MSKRLILPILLLGLLLGASSAVFAQDIPLPNDTMKVVDNHGRAGDTVQVGLYFANSIKVGAYQGRLIFNPNILQIISVTGIPPRGNILEFTSGEINNDSVLIFLGYTMTAGRGIAIGSGVVANIKLLVKPDAQVGSTLLRFVDASGAVNAWADTTGGYAVYYPRLVDGTFTVTGGSSNLAPVISNIGPQEVREGQTLQFVVNAYDYDGDNLTLSAQNLPPNASFPTAQGDSAATGSFTFTPTFEQGPDTLFVIFVATDDHNNVTQLTVQIIILNQPNDFLSVDSRQGGVPGALGRDINVDMLNSRNVYGVQFDYYYDPQQIDVVDVVPTDRCLGLGFWYNEPDPGRIIVLIFSPGLDPISIGDGTIVRFVTNVNTTALFGPSAVVLDSAVEVIDSIGTSANLTTNNGFFTVDRFGDANLDGLISVGDCVRIVSSIIGRYVLNTREFDAADMNRDGRVNVSDLQNTIDWILEIPTLLAPLSPTPLVSVELKKDPNTSGDIISISLWGNIETQAAAFQYQLNYNSDRLEPLDAVPGDMLRNLRFDKSAADGKFKGVFYDMGGSTFGPASGELVTFTFREKTGQFSPSDLNLSEFLIVDRGSALISTEIKGQLPSEYSLNQNYPNPFNSSTKISFDMPEDGQVELSVYDVLGRKVATLINETMTAGSHSINWDGRSQDGEIMATGVFFYRLQAKDFDETKRMLLVK
jgi:hypothetical protein